MQDKDLQTVEIDLNANKNGEVTESWLEMFGSNVKRIMRAMFGGSSFPVNVRGDRRQILDFTNLLGTEKQYIKTASKYGLDDPRTFKDKFLLRKNIRKFEGSTGLKWPFK